MKQKSVLFYVLFALFALWTAAGAFPLICFEEDSSMLIVSVQHMLDNGWQVSPRLNYCYSTQPLIYYVLAAFVSATGLAVDTSYCLLTLAAALALAWLIIAFVNRLTGIRREFVLAALFLLPESSAIASYPNSAVFAALTFMGGMHLMLRRRYVWATLLLGVAPLLRADVLCVYPVVLPLIMWQGAGFRRSLGYSAAIAAGVCAVYFGGFYAMSIESADSNMTIAEAIETYLMWSKIIARFEHYRTLLAFYGLPALLFLPWGAIEMWRRRQLKLLATAAVAIGCCHAVFLGMGCAAKHYLYILPFVCIVYSFAIDAFARRLKSKSPVAATILCALCLFEVSALGIDRVLPTEEPISSFAPRLELASRRVGNFDVSVGLGAGHPVYTADEITLLTGQIFFPKFMFDYKSRIKELRTEVIDALPRSCRFMRYGEPNSGMYLLMRAKGYRIVGEDVDLHDYLGEAADAHNSRYILEDADGNRIDDMYITHTPEQMAFTAEAKGKLATGDFMLRNNVIMIRSAIERVGYEMPTYIASIDKDYDLNTLPLDILTDEGVIEPVVDGLWRVCPRATPSEGVADGEVEGERLAE